jgi:hypothetical protein
VLFGQQNQFKPNLAHAGMDQTDFPGDTIGYINFTPFLIGTPVIDSYKFELTASGVHDADDAAGWRDRPIHKLVSTRVVTHTDARRLFQGIGLVDAAHAGAMRGRLWIVSDTADPWGVCAILRGERAAILIDVPTVQHETMAIVTLEIERNR